jgi:hypothetical protein
MYSAVPRPIWRNKNMLIKNPLTKQENHILSEMLIEKIKASVQKEGSIFYYNQL